MPSWTRSGLTLLANLAALPAWCASPDGPWFAHAGVARFAAREDIRTDIPDAAVHLAPRYAAALEIGRYVTPTLAFGLTAGTPIRQQVQAAGSIRALGTLGKVTYGPAAATMHWHPIRSGTLRPYAGGGVAYLHVFDDDAGTLAGFRLRNDLGPVLQGGIEMMAAHGVGLFVDAKKAWLSSRATGSLGGAPVDARLRLDPLVLSGGLAVRF